MAKHACQKGGGHRAVQLDYDLARESMAILAFDLANRMEKAGNFLSVFVILPAESGEQEEEDLSCLTWGLGVTPSGWWMDWITESLAPKINTELDILRDWVACFMPGHYAMFDARIWHPMTEHRKTMEKQWNDAAPWPDALNHASQLSRAAACLGMFCKAIAHPEGKGIITRGPADLPDKFGTPARLSNIANVLRREGRRLTTKELEKLLGGMDVNTHIAKTHKDERQKVEAFADKHLRNGHGWWLWRPPKLPAQ
jgi:hypothetical protein